MTTCLSTFKRKYEDVFRLSLVTLAVPLCGCSEVAPAAPVASVVPVANHHTGDSFISLGQLGSGHMLITSMHHGAEGERVAAGINKTRQASDAAPLMGLLRSPCHERHVVSMLFVQFRYLKDCEGPKTDCTVE